MATKILQLYRNRPTICRVLCSLIMKVIMILYMLDDIFHLRVSLATIVICSIVMPHIVIN